MYCTIDNLKDRIGEEVLIQLVDKDEAGTLDTTNQQRVQDIIDNVSATIDLYAKKTVPIPLTDEIDLKVANEIALAKCKFHLYQNSTIKTDENVITAYKAAMKKLEKVSWIGEAAVTTESVIGSKVKTSAKVFDDDYLSGY